MPRDDLYEQMTLQIFHLSLAEINPSIFVPKLNSSLRLYLDSVWWFILALPFYHSRHLSDGPLAKWRTGRWKMPTRWRGPTRNTSSRRSFGWESTIPNIGRKNASLSQVRKIFIFQPDSNPRPSDPVDLHHSHTSLTGLGPFGLARSGFIC